MTASAGDFHTGVSRAEAGHACQRQEFVDEPGGVVATEVKTTVDCLTRMAGDGGLAGSGMWTALRLGLPSGEGVGR